MHSSRNGLINDHSNPKLAPRYRPSTSRLVSSHTSERCSSSGERRPASRMAATCPPVSVLTALRGRHGESTVPRSEEHTSELQSLMRISYAVFCLKKKKNQIATNKSTKMSITKQ